LFDDESDDDHEDNIGEDEIDNCLD